MKVIIIYNSPAMQKVMKEINRIAALPISILLCGETGTGKNLLARYIHELSPQKDGPFVLLDCATLSSNLLESELFGHEKGAFTGATERKIGRVEMANGGTLFLNEVQNLSLEAQSKLLGVVETGTFCRVGGTQERRVCFRLIAATNADLLELMKAGRFREDLYFRLNQMRIDIPPLRERREDILPLAEHFIQEFRDELGKTPRLSPETQKLLLVYSWPGNVRELRNVLYQAVARCERPELRPEDLPLEVRHEALVVEGKETHWSLEEMERRYITAVLEGTHGNLTQASEILGIARGTLKRKIKKYKL